MITLVFSFHRLPLHTSLSILRLVCYTSPDRSCKSWRSLVPRGHLGSGQSVMSILITELQRTEKTKLVPERLVISVHVLKLMLLHLYIKAVEQPNPTATPPPSKKYH